MKKIIQSGIVFVSINFAIYFYILCPLLIIAKERNSLTITTLAIMLSSFIMLLRIRLSKIDLYNKNAYEKINKTQYSLGLNDTEKMSFSLIEEYNLDRKLRRLSKEEIAILEDLKKDSNIEGYSFNNKPIGYKTINRFIWHGVIPNIVNNKTMLFRYLTDYLIILGVTFFTANYISEKYLIFVTYPIFFLPILYCYYYINLIESWKFKVEQNLTKSE